MTVSNNKVWKSKTTNEEKTQRFWVQSLLFKPRTHDDDRRRGVYDVFDTPQGDFLITHIYPGAISAWHRHSKQTDYLFVIKGSLKIGLYDEQKKLLTFVYLHDQERITLKIPLKIWHGHKNVSADETILCYYISEKYNQNHPDEERAPIGSFGDNWNLQAK